MCSICAAVCELVSSPLFSIAFRRRTCSSAPLRPHFRQLMGLRAGRQASGPASRDSSSGEGCPLRSATPLARFPSICICLLPGRLAEHASGQSRSRSRPLQLGSALTALGLSSLFVYSSSAFAQMNLSRRAGQLLRLNFALGVHLRAHTMAHFLPRSTRLALSLSPCLVFDTKGTPFPPLGHFLPSLARLNDEPTLTARASIACFP